MPTSTTWAGCSGWGRWSGSNRPPGPSVVFALGAAAFCFFVSRWSEAWGGEHRAVQVVPRHRSLVGGVAVGPHGTVRCSHPIAPAVGVREDGRSLVQAPERSHGNA